MFKLSPDVLFIAQKQLRLLTCERLCKTPKFVKRFIHHTSSQHVCTESSKNQDQDVENLLARGICVDAVEARKLLEEAKTDARLRRRLPNKTHQEVSKMKNDEIRVISTSKFEWRPKSKNDIFLNENDYNVEADQSSHTRPEFHVRSFSEIASKIHKNGVKTDNISPYCGSKAYYLQGQYAELERALISYTLDALMNRDDEPTADSSDVNKNFELISVPDLLDEQVVDDCGFDVHGERTQVYRLGGEGHEQTVLSGTSEMAFGALFRNTTLNSETKLPKRLCATSRCFRAETSNLKAERPIYRVHQFTKVEMFALTEPHQSGEIHQEFLDIQKGLFDGLELDFRVLDMPPNELGKSAFRKYDIEALLPGHSQQMEGQVKPDQYYAEVSSTSNCTDYQSRRLNIIKAEKDSSRGKDSTYVHTVNGTACAVPRMIMAIVEQNQLSNGTVIIPHALRRFMRGQVSLLTPPLTSKTKKNKGDALQPPINVTYKHMKSPKFFIDKTNEADVYSHVALSSSSMRENDVEGFEDGERGKFGGEKHEIERKGGRNNLDQLTELLQKTRL